MSSFRNPTQALTGGDAGPNPIDATFLGALKKISDDAAAAEKKNAGKVVEDADVNEILSKTVGAVSAKSIGL